MKDTLLNTFDPFMTIMICLLLVIGSLTWTNKYSIKPFMLPKPSLKSNKFL